MAGGENGRQPNPVPDARGALLQRPQTLLQRISSSLTTIRLAMTPRRLTTRYLPPPRPRTAPAFIDRSHPEIRRDGSPAPLSGRFRAPSPPNMPFFSDPDLIPEEPCPYDAEHYHSFPSIEPQGCRFCGLTNVTGMKTTTLTWTTSTPCDDCRSGTAASHLRETMGARRRSRLEQRSGLSRQTDTTATTNPTTNNAAARTSRPIEQRRPLTLEQQTPSQTETARPLSPRPDSSQRTRRGAISAPPVSTAARPLSPALHYLPLVPRSKDYPYVHKHEVGAHIDALRAGSPSPLRQSPDVRSSSRRNRRMSEQGFVDYTETVYYGDGRTTKRSKRVPKPDTRSGRNVLIIASYNAEVGDGVGAVAGRQRQETGRVVGEVEEEAPGIEQRIESSRTGRRSVVQRTETQDSQMVGGRRMELKGGSTRETLRLRGGAAEDEDERCGFSPCRRVPVLLHRCVNHDRASRTTRSPALRPSRIITHSRLARRRHGISRTASLPLHLHRNPRSTQTPPIPQPTTHPAPVLRGGAASPNSHFSTLFPADKIPPTLFWLAGGKGKPVSVAGYRQSRSRKRMGGLLGMAVHGTRAGEEYRGHGEAVEEAGGSQMSGGTSSTSSKGSSGRSGRTGSRESSSGSSEKSGSGSAGGSRRSSGVSRGGAGSASSGRSVRPEAVRDGGQVGDEGVGESEVSAVPERDGN